MIISGLKGRWWTTRANPSGDHSMGTARTMGCSREGGGAIQRRTTELGRQRWVRS